MSPTSWKRIAIAVLLAVEVIVLASVAWVGRGGPDTGIVVRGSEASLEVSPQSAVSTTITIDRAVAPGPAWIVIRAQTLAGGLGSVIGSAHIDGGVSIDVPVSVEPTALPAEATALLVVDRGTLGKLEYAAGQMGGGNSGADVPYIADGSYVSDTFGISPLTSRVAAGVAAIGSVSRGVESASVVASNVVAPGPSWLAVSATTTSGAPGRILGESPVPQGVSPSISVAIPSTAATQALMATLQVDLGQPGRFEYSSAGLGSGPDQPYVAGGQTVSLPVPPLPTR